MKTEPVMTQATAIAAIWALIISACAWAGVSVPTEVQAAMVPAILAAAWLARGHVTPTWRPKTKDGVDLVPDLAQDHAEAHHG